MKILAVIAHPGKESFNHAIFKRAIQTLKNLGHDVLFHDLYTEKFDPVLSFEEIKKTAKFNSKLATYCNELTGSDGLLFVHPNWWGQPPAILTGWIDRVFQPGIAYEFNEGDNGAGVPRGLLAGKRALVFNTSDTPEKREFSFFGDPLENIWTKCILEFCGIKKYRRGTFGPIVTSTAKLRQQWLEEVGRVTEDVFS